MSHICKERGMVDLQHDVWERFSGRHVGRRPQRDVRLGLDLILEEADVATEARKLLKTDNEWLKKLELSIKAKTCIILFVNQLQIANIAIRLITYR